MSSAFLSLVHVEVDFMYQVCVILSFFLVLVMFRVCDRVFDHNFTLKLATKCCLLLCCVRVSGGGSCILV